MVATMTGDSRRAHGLFLGLAEDEANRPLLRDTIEFLGLIDLQDTVIGRKARNTGHKAIRARAVTDLANYIGWERSHGVFYMGVPDMAVGPLYYSLYDEACVRIAAEFPEDAGKNLKQTNQTPLSPREVEEMLELLMTADAGHGVGPAHRASEDRQVDQEPRRHDPARRRRTDPAHYRAAPVHQRAAPVRLLQCREQLAAHHRQPVPGAHPVPDGEFHQRRGAREQAAELGHRARRPPGSTPAGGRRTRCCGSSTRRSWRSTSARATAVADAYLQIGRGPPAYMETVALAACRFQDDPHNQKITISTFEEYGHNSTHLRDRLLLATPRLLAGWVKMPGERDFARFEKEWSSIQGFPGSLVVAESSGKSRRSSLPVADRRALPAQFGSILVAFFSGIPSWSVRRRAGPGRSGAGWQASESTRVDPAPTP